MPAVPPTLPANASTRRSFLARTAGLGAVASLVAVAAPTAGLLPAASAQSGPSNDYTDAEFAAFTTPLELAAVQVYQAALTNGAVSGDAAPALQRGQDHHQSVADALTTLLDADAPAPIPAIAFSDPVVAKISATTDAPTILRALAEVENTISATHLLALESIPDPITAKTVAQVLAVEAQQATYLAYLAGDEVADLTPEVASATDGLQPGDVDGAPPAEFSSDATAAGN